MPPEGLEDVDRMMDMRRHSEAPAVKVFRCPMKKANWLQEGMKTANPYYGSEMFDCGSAIETLPL